jgi:hypothetical protein
MATYYVSTSGDNGNTGLDVDHPWATLEYAESHATTAGDIIALKKGDTWTLDDGFEISHGGSAGTYITWDGNLWGTGSKAIILSGNQVHWNRLCHIAACDYLIVQNITFDVNHHNVSGIVIGGDEESVGPTSQNDERYITIKDCDVLDTGDGTSYMLAILVQTKYTDMYNISVDGCYISYSSSYGVCFYMDRYADPEDRKVLHNGYIGNNYITLCGQYSGGPAHHIFLNNGIDGCIIEHNTIEQGASGNAPGISLSYSTDDLPHRPRNITIRYNNVTVTTQEAFCIFEPLDDVVNVYYNIFRGTDTDQYKSVVSLWTGAYTGASMTFYNNVIISETDESYESACFMNYDSGNHSTFRNNILVSTGTLHGSPLIQLGTANNITHSNNSFHRTLAGSDVHFVDNGVTEYTRTDVDTWEASCVEGDPVFVTNYTDLHLQVTSPCINEGYNVGLSVDLDNNAVSYPCELGVYEYGAGSSDVIISKPKIHNWSTI